MSLMTFVQECEACHARWSAGFGTVHTNVIAEPPDKCPKCSGTQLKNVANGWKETIPIVRRRGTWWMHSKSDPRWNGSGQGYVGGFIQPTKVDKHLEQKRSELGEPPDDLEWGYMKD